jgi:hypothetical protein
MRCGKLKIMTSGKWATGGSAKGHLGDEPPDFIQKSPSIFRLPRKLKDEQKTLTRVKLDGLRVSSHVGWR